MRYYQSTNNADGCISYDFEWRNGRGFRSNETYSVGPCEGILAKLPGINASQGVQKSYTSGTPDNTTIPIIYGQTFYWHGRTYWHSDRGRDFFKPWVDITDIVSYPLAPNTPQERPVLQVPYGILRNLPSYKDIKSLKESVGSILNVNKGVVRTK